VNVEEISLTLPGDDEFHGVAHLVLGGLATRHDLTVETLEDLTLAVDAVLGRYAERSAEVTVRVRVGDDHVQTEVGPFRNAALRGELERESGDALDVRRILFAVCDGVSVADRDGAEWVEMTKRVERAAGEAA
jgi:hypothetical protein